MHRKLNEKEEIEFKDWARQNYNPIRDDINYLWHPVIIAECMEIDKEYAESCENIVLEQDYYHGGVWQDS